MSNHDRAQTRQRLQSSVFDVLVIGGGISGAWIALQCRALGLDTALLERGDFAGETSAASSKLLHGGIRYLQQVQLGKVRESAMERAEYLHAAPHLAQAVPFIIPTYRDLKRSKLLLRCGMAVYRMLGIGQGKRMGSRNHALPATRLLSKNQLNAVCDLSHHAHTGAMVFPEYQMHDSERTVWSIIASALNRGAIVANYTEVIELIVKENAVTGVVANSEGGTEPLQIRARLVVNAAGPWVDAVNRHVQSPKRGEVPAEPGAATSPARTSSAPTSASAASPVPAPIISNYAAGAHVITRQLMANYAIAISTPHKSGAKIDRGGRHVFIIPWRGHSLIGTSYRETTDPDNARLLNPEDLNQLLDTVNEALPHAALTDKDVISAYSGLYPLRVDNLQSSVYQGSGEYVIVDHAKNTQLEGLVTALGAKFTTGRILAEKTLEVVVNKLSKAPELESKLAAYTGSALHQALRVRLHSSHYGDGDVDSDGDGDAPSLSDFRSQQQRKLANTFSGEQIDHLVSLFGSELDDFLAFIDVDNARGDKLQRVVAGQPDVLGQVYWAVTQEMSLHLDDVLLRRTSCGLLGISEQEASRVAAIMAELLGWNADQQANELKQFLARQAAIEQASASYFAGRRESVENRAEHAEPVSATA